MAKRKSVKRKSPTKLATRKRKSRKSVRRKSVKRKSRKSVTRKSVTRKSRKSVKRKSRKSVKRKSRKSVKRKSVKRKSVKRKSVKRKSRKSVKRKSRKSVKRKSRKSVKRKSRKSAKRKSRKPVNKIPFRANVNYKQPHHLMQPLDTQDITTSQSHILQRLQTLPSEDPSRPFFLSVQDKLLLQNVIHKIIGKNHFQCFNKTNGIGQNLINKIQVEKYISEGSFGRVFIGCFPVTDKTMTGAQCDDDSIRIAVKTTGILPLRVADAKAKVLDYQSADWNEAITMNNLVNPLIKSTYTPHLPFLYQWYFCESCKPLYTHGGCMILLTELAREDMASMFKYRLQTLANNTLNINGKEFDGGTSFLLCSLFQIMNGLNAMQQYPQIVHKDIKVQNMLVHRIPENPNEFVHYNVNGQDYWLPNIGSVAMISDFGLCYSENPLVPSVFPIDPKAPENMIPSRKLRDLGLRPGVIMGPPGKEKLSLFEHKSDGGDETQICLLKDWGGASDLFGYTNPTLAGRYGMSALNIHDKSPVGTLQFSIGPLATKLSPSMFLHNMTTKLTPPQIKYMTSKGLEANPLALEFYTNVQYVPSVDFCIDTQDVLRSFGGGARAAFGHTHQSAIWHLGPLLPKASLDLLAEVSKFITVGPSTDDIPHAMLPVFAYPIPKNTETIIISDNPATILASYFIRDFKPFDIFKQKPPANSKIIGSFRQPNGSGSIKFA